MPTAVLEPNRRQLFQLLSGAAALAASSAIAPPLFASDDKILDIRRGAKPLLLHFNENSLGMSPKAIQAAQAAVRDVAHRYADDMIADLTDKLAAHHNVPKAQIVMGNGSTEILKAVVRMAANVGGTLIEPSPTFGVARDEAKAEGMPVVSVPVRENFTTNLAALRARTDSLNGPVLINICNPNNPTGTICGSDELTDWIRAAPEQHFFLIDEAYFDYAQPNPAYKSMLPLIREGADNLIVARTFSKVYGMAGMRVGYGIAGPAAIGRIKPYSASYNLNAAGTAAAIASMEDTAFYERSRTSNADAKAFLTATLDRLGLAYIPSDTNFLLHRIGGPLADYSRRMKANGVRVGRRMTKEDGWNRLSIGTPAEMQAFADTLIAFRKHHWI